MTLPVPPRYVNIPSSVKYSRDGRATAAVKQIYDELRGLAWQNNYHSTPPLDRGELLSFLGIGRSAFYEHLKTMTDLGWLRSEGIGQGKLRILFSPQKWTPSTQSAGSPHLRTLSGFADDLGGVKIINTTAAELQDKEIKAAAVINNTAFAKKFAALEPVTEPERTRLAETLTKTPEQIKADIARWEKTGGGIGLLVVMLRNDKPALTDEEQRQSYVTGEYADFVEH